jgi:hypothetical protein
LRDNHSLSHLAFDDPFVAPQVGDFINTALYLLGDGTAADKLVDQEGEDGHLLDGTEGLEGAGTQDYAYLKHKQVW